MRFSIAGNGLTNEAGGIRIFVDMDGVLAEFQVGKQLSDLYQEGYFENLPPQPHAIRAYKKLAMKYEVYILSCYFDDSPYALAEKKRWVQKYLPGAKCIFIPCGQSKADAILEATGKPIGPDDILIDDHSPNIIDWDAKGGYAIKYLNGINGAGNKWKGRRAKGDFSKRVEKKGSNKMKKIMASMVVMMTIAVFGLTTETLGNGIMANEKSLDELDGQAKKVEKIVKPELKKAAEQTEEISLVETEVKSTPAVSDKKDTKKPQKTRDKKDQTKEDKEDVTDPEEETTVVDESSSIEINVSCEDREYRLGERIVFEISVTNTGSKDTSITVSDFDGSREAEVKAGDTVFTQSFWTVTEDDIADENNVCDAVTVYYGDKSKTAFASAKIEPIRTGLQIDEVLSAPANGTDYEPTEVITVTVTVTNIGNQTARFPHIVSDAAGYEWVVPAIKPGETRVFTTTFVKDPNAGRYFDGSNDDEDEGLTLDTPEPQTPEQESDNDDQLQQSEEPQAGELEAAEPKTEAPKVEEPKAEPPVEETPAEEPQIKEPQADEE